MGQQSHWDAIYQQKRPEDVSWYAPHLATSRSLILANPQGTDAAVIDVGGGASTLVDDLLDAGFRRVTVLDIARRALERSQARLGAKAALVTWIAADVAEAPLAEHGYDVWHDRAVFHFLVREEDRRTYVAQLHRALRPGGQVILATFALSGPPKCSGLPVARYSPQTLQAALGQRVILKEARPEAHTTPFGTAQDFIYCRFECATLGERDC